MNDHFTNPLFDLFTPTECREFEFPRDHGLVGDGHLSRGDITVLAGVPGSGKSRLAVGLAVAGATGEDWMGHPVNSRFRTMILQAENGIARLKSEFADIDAGDVDLDEYLRITPPPRAGLRFDWSRFRSCVRRAIEHFGAELLVIDSWQQVLEHGRHFDCRAFIDAIDDSLPTNPADRPAVLIVSHVGKQPGGGGRRQRSDLFSKRSGSQSLALAARCVFTLQAATADTGDDRVVLACCKNTHGELGTASAWHRRNGLFEPCQNFPWEDYWNPGPGGDDFDPQL
jgi:RecA-family ATPase